MTRFGTRTSPLAQAQTDRVLDRHAGSKVLIGSDGDQDLVSALHHMQAPGAFTRTLTAAVLDGRVDAAVHSLKDLPLDAPEGAPLVAVLARDDPADVILVRPEAYASRAPMHLKPGSRIGTSAPRRQAQARAADPSLVCVDVRGNVQTRIGLLEAGVVDGLVMAAAVFDRMPPAVPEGIVRHRLDPTGFPGSPGQGAVAVQARPDLSSALGHLDDAETHAAVRIEREVLRALGGGCGLPLGCHVALDDDVWHLWATYGHPEGQTRVHLEAAEADTLIGPAVAALRTPPRPDTAHATGGPVVLLTLEEERLGAYRHAMPGATLEAWPLLHTEETDAAPPAGWDTCGWIAVASRRAAQAAARAAQDFAAKPRIAAVGPATVDALRRLGLAVHAVARDGAGAGLADAIAAFPKPPAPVLVPQAERPSDGLRRGLEARGFPVLEWPVYRTTVRAVPRPPCDVVVLCSASAARAYAGACYPPGPRLIAFGPTTAAAMRDAGLEVHGTCLLRGPAGVRDLLLAEVQR